MTARTVKSIVGVAVVLACLAVPPAFANTAIGYVPLVAAVLLVALCFGYLMALRGALRFSDECPAGGTVRGEVLPFQLVVRNASLLPAVRVEAEFYISDAFGGTGTTMRQHIALPPRSEHRFDLGVRLDHVGTFQVGMREVVVSDPFGIFYSRRPAGGLRSVQVTPRLVDVSGMQISDDSLQESTKNIKAFINEGMDYSGVRDYRWGDPIKSIHWKLSSKAIPGNYFTRMYETPTTPGVAIFMDFEAPYATADLLMASNDAVVEAALSIERFASASGYESDVFFAGQAGEHRHFTGPIAGRMNDLMARVPLMAAGRGRNLLSLLAAEANSIYCQNNLVVCSANVTDELVSALLDLAGPSRFPMLVAVLPHESGAAEDPAVRQRLARLGAAHIPCRAIAQASDLEGGE